MSAVVVRGLALLLMIIRGLEGSRIDKLGLEKAVMNGDCRAKTAAHEELGWTVPRFQWSGTIIDAFHGKVTGYEVGALAVGQVG